MQQFQQNNIFLWVLFYILSFSTLSFSLVTVSFANGKNTHSHSGQWIETQDLKPGMKLVTADNKKLTIIEAWNYKKKTTTYNFEVNNTHSYFVGKNKIWSHNACSGDLDKFSDNVAYNMGNKGLTKDVLTIRVSEKLPGKAAKNLSDDKLREIVKTTNKLASQQGKEVHLIIDEGLKTRMNHLGVETSSNIFIHEIKLPVSTLADTLAEESGSMLSDMLQFMSTITP